VGFNDDRTFALCIQAGFLEMVRIAEAGLSNEYIIAGQLPVR
jgi:hypothetical protein